MSSLQTELLSVFLFINLINTEKKCCGYGQTDIVMIEVKKGYNKHDFASKLYVLDLKDKISKERVCTVYITLTILFFTFAFQFRMCMSTCFPS